MNGRLEKAIIRFLRTFDKPFTASDFCTLLSTFGEDVSISEASEFLDADDRVFPLQGRYYITRSAAFTGMFFSFAPTQQELEQKLFVPGDRCMPFVDPEILSCSLKFEYCGKILPKKVFDTDCNTARNLFTFYGDEYSSQYIGADPVNADLELANNNFELPPKLHLTGVSLEKVFEDMELVKGDRILCRVNNWDKGIVEIFPIANHCKNPFIRRAEVEDREQWICNLEKSLLGIFDSMGPCMSMEQQLAFSFFDNRKTLCTPECGSIHEFLDRSQKVSMELFGVETRLWRKGENVPAVGVWNKDFNNAVAASHRESVFSAANIPDFLIDCVIQDRFYEKKTDMDNLLDLILPKSQLISPEEEQYYSLQIMNRSAILREHYNWFADYTTGPLRHKALELYTRVGDLVYDIDCASEMLEQFPQQELVILSQLFTHISRILEMFANGVECEEEEKTALKMSLEGMEYNFEDIRTQLKAAVDKYRAGKFKII